MEHNTCVSIPYNAAAGVFMALQITYKWDIPFVKTVLSGMLSLELDGIHRYIPFHLASLLFPIRSLTRQTCESDHHIDIQQLTSSEISINLFIIGLVSSSVQLLLLREMMNISGGYELVTGIFLGSWLIGSAIGAALAGSSQSYGFKKDQSDLFTESFFLSDDDVFSVTDVFKYRRDSLVFRKSDLYFFGSDFLFVWCRDSPLSN